LCEVERSRGTAKSIAHAVMDKERIWELPVQDYGKKHFGGGKNRSVRRSGFCAAENAHALCVKRETDGGQEFHGARFRSTNEL